MWRSTPISTTPNFRDLTVELVSPSGAVSTLSPSAPISGVVDLGKFRFGSARHLGEDAAGEWTLRIKDAQSGDNGMLKSWSGQSRQRTPTSEPTDTPTPTPVPETTPSNRSQLQPSSEPEPTEAPTVEPTTTPTPEPAPTAMSVPEPTAAPTKTPAPLTQTTTPETDVAVETSGPGNFAVAAAAALLLAVGFFAGYLVGRRKSA